MAIGALKVKGDSRRIVRSPGFNRRGRGQETVKVR
jgi:hypothetical protein